MLEHSNEDMFDKACKRLEKISALKEKNILDDSEYKDIKTEILSQMKQATIPSVETSVEKLEYKEPKSVSEAENELSLSAGQIHQKVVEKISENYKHSKGDDKQNMLRAISDMADSQLLNPGDSLYIKRTIEIVYSPLSINDSDNFSDKLVETLAGLNEVHSQVRINPNCSPATKTIIGITQQSSNEAAEEIRIYKENNEPASNKSKKNLWKKLVLKDLAGALSGGSAAGGICQALAWSVPLATLTIISGILVGAGIQSGIAYAETNQVL